MTIDHRQLTHDPVPPAWQAPLREEVDSPYFRELSQFVESQRRRHVVFPPAGEVFAALEAVAPADVRAVILGQDPYHGEGQAHGLAFSVRPDVKPPPSLANIFRELKEDLGIEPSSPCLLPWARQGVLLLNSVLTVRQGEPHSHQRRGWERLTDAIVAHLAACQRPICFILWGKPAQQKARQVGEPHPVLKSAHPSPLSARRGFFGSRPFSTANAALQAAGAAPIDWRL